jgi:hypothetical protein
MDCKDRLDKYEKGLLKLKKADVYYEYTKRDIDYHSKYTWDLIERFGWDSIMIGNILDNYEKYLMDFSNEKELMMSIRFNKEYANYIKHQIDSINKQVEIVKQQILKTPILIIAEKELSGRTQKEKGVKKLQDLINIKLRDVFNIIDFQDFSYKDNEKQIRLPLCEMEVEKLQFLRGEYRGIEFDKEFFRKLFNSLASSCDKISSLSDITENDFSQYEIYSNISFKNDIETLLPNDKASLYFNDSPILELTSIDIKEQKIKVSRLNYLFDRLSENRFYPICLMLINKSKLSIVKGNHKAVTLKEEKGNIEIINDTSIYINIPKNEKIGYMVCIEDEKITKNEKRPKCNDLFCWKTFKNTMVKMLAFAGMKIK